MATAAEKLQDVEKRAKKKKTEDVGQLSQWTLIQRRFMRSKLSVIGLIVLIIMYFMAIFADFIAPYQFDQLDPDHKYAAPTQVTWANGGLGVYGVTRVLDKENYTYSYVVDPNVVYPIRLFAPSAEYTMFGFIPLHTRLFGLVTPPDVNTKLYLWGADALGRDVFSRVLKGGQVSLSIGFIGVLLQMTLATIIG
ncbi:MAG TPA: ABC transporter permease, partial [Roseiflexaceae bacterium]|nr:ABC transporter permease [Roseiflexaceae bacterium]